MAPRIQNFEDFEDDAALVSMYATANEFWTTEEDEQEFDFEANRAVDDFQEQEQLPVSIWRPDDLAEEFHQDGNNEVSTIANETEDSSIQQMIRPSWAFDEDDLEMEDEDDEWVEQDEEGFGLSASRRMLFRVSLDPHTTSYEDLERMVDHGYSLCDMLQAVMDKKSSRLMSLAMRLLTHFARHSVDDFTPGVLALLAQILGTQHSSDWLQQECAALVVRTLTTHEAMDSQLVSLEARILPALGLVAQGGGHRLFFEPSHNALTAAVTEQARLHASIAIMNLSCGTANKTTMAEAVVVLQALKTMLLDPSNEALRLNASATLKNLSSLETNDVALIRFPGLVHALGKVIWDTTTMYSIGASSCTVNACMTLMNLSISKYCKRQIYHTPGVMQALMQVLTNTMYSSSTSSCALDARVSACSVLSNLAIGYENKSSMFHYCGLLDMVSSMAATGPLQARSKACSVLWSLAAEKDNQVPMVRDRADVLAVLIRVAAQKRHSEARQKCVAALALLAESSSNALSLLQAGVLQPLLSILDRAGTDPTQWRDHTPSWCVTCIVNLAQQDAAVPILREAGVVQLLSPLVATDHEYQSLKASMAVTLCCRSCHATSINDDPRYYFLLRRVEMAIPKITSLLFNTLEGRGGDGYKYGVFTLSSTLACVAALASGPDFIQERICTRPVLLSLLRVLWEFGVDGGACDRIIGGGPDDFVSASWATKALSSVIIYLLSTSDECPGDGIDLVVSFTDPLVRALQSAEQRFASRGDDFSKLDAAQAANARRLVAGTANIVSRHRSRGEGCERQYRPQRRSSIPAVVPNNRQSKTTGLISDTRNSPVSVIAAGLVVEDEEALVVGDDESSGSSILSTPTLLRYHHPPAAVRTFILVEERTGREYLVPTTTTTGDEENFLDDTTMRWCFRRGRYCGPGEFPDPSFVWTAELQRQYDLATCRKCLFRDSSTGTTTNSSDKNPQPYSSGQLRSTEIEGFTAN